MSLSEQDSRDDDSSISRGVGGTTLRYQFSKSCATNSPDSEV